MTRARPQLASTAGVRIDLLGQAGARLRCGRSTIYIDPYLSDSVERKFGSDLRRMAPPPYSPASVKDAAIVLITHAHLDHCDPDTLLPLASASPQARFIGPAEVCELLLSFGISEDRIGLASMRGLSIDDSVRVQPVAAAHPRVERDQAGNSRYLGYVVETALGRIYHAGDTSITDEVFRSAMDFRPFRAAMLPVNERNYFRDRSDIVGNMTVREAFQFASELKVETLLPIHWDMFQPNSVERDELILLHQRLGCQFDLRFGGMEL